MSFKVEYLLSKHQISVAGFSQLYFEVQEMTKTYKPGQNTGKDGGSYQEVGPRGGLKENYSTVRDNQRLPPTTTPGNGWVRINRTPDSKR